MRLAMSAPCGRLPNRSGNASKIWDYVLHHPESPHVDEARAEHARLTGTQSAPQIADTPPVASSSPIFVAPTATDAKSYDLALWTSAKNSGDADKVWDYVLHHPDGPYVEEARAEHARLTGQSAPALKNCTKQGLKCGVPIGGCTLAQ